MGRWKLSLGLEAEGSQFKLYMQTKCGSCVGSRTPLEHCRGTLEQGAEPPNVYNVAMSWCLF